MIPALAMEDARRSLRGAPVLQGLSLSIAPGECRALVGLNGAGKTTALRAMLGMLRLASGRVRVLGQDVHGPHRDVWGRVGYLVETPFCYPELTARENVRASARLRGTDAAEVETRCEELADRLGLTAWLDVPARRLSSGTRQKVGLIAATVHRPRLVLLDEPTTALDPLAVVALRTLVAELTAQGTAVLVTSHHLDELARMAGQVDVLHRGRIVATIDPSGTDLERAFFEIVLAAESSTPTTGAS